MTTFKRYSLLSILLLCSLFALQVFADEEAFDPEFVEAEFHEFPVGQRHLGGYPNIRVYADYEWVDNGDGSPEFKTYIKKHLIPAVVSYFQSALKVRHPLTSKISSTKTTLCGSNTPKAIKAGVEADIVFIINAKNVPSASWLAATTLCTIATSNNIKKPQIINVSVNSAFIDIADPIDNPLWHDLNINTLLHEFIHGFAMTGSLYKYFVDQNNEVLEGHDKEIDLNGEVRQVIDVPSLTTRLRNFYGCNTIPGLVMENDGGAHLERRYYQYEVMASGGRIESKITEITLGFLEASGWYVPDYTFAEPYFFGRGQGCGFYYDKCEPSNFEEFCSGEEKGCSPLGESGGYCKDDSRSESCRFYYSQSYFNCENPKGIYYTSLASKQVYGRGLGSKCFAGNLTSSKSGTPSPNAYCFTYKCFGAGSQTYIEVDFGTTTFKCTKKGLTTVSGYYGFINCPDPLEYCTTIGRPTCSKNCLGRGKCVEGKCQCDAGWEGTDCGFAKL